GSWKRIRNFQMTASTNSRLPLSLLRLEANVQFAQIDRRSMRSVSQAASIKKAPINHASRGYHTRVAPRAATAVNPLLFEQRLDDRPLVGQVHARPVRRLDRNRL